MSVRLNKILKNGRAMYLAYDQGLEHGPAMDFNDDNVDPLYILEIAKKGKFQGVVFQKGIADKYSREIKASKVPLIVKLNGRTALFKGEPLSRQLCTVKEAIKFGAAAVGYTLYIGSEYESTMLQEFEAIEREAHAKGIPVIAWVYPKGKSIKNPTSREMMSYAARVALEIGADIVKIKYGGNSKDLEWTIKSAGKTKVVIAGGIKQSEKIFLKQVKEIMKAGAIGLAIGRNVWQHPRPLEIAKKIREIIWKNN